MKQLGIFGIHDPGGEHLFGADGGTVVHTFDVRTDAPLAAVYTAAVIYAGLFWMRLRLLRLLMLTIMMFCLAVDHSLDTMIAAGNWPVSFYWVSAAQWAARVTAAISGFLVVDLTAASLNSHLAVTTVAYNLWIRVSDEKHIPRPRRVGDVLNEEKEREHRHESA